MLQKLRDFLYHACNSAWRLSLTALSVIAIIGFSGCMPTSGSSDGVILQLSTWGSAQEISVLRGLLSEFEQEHPNIHIQLLHIPENYYQKLHILVAGDMTPDVMFTNSISFPIYAAHGVFLDLRPYLNNAGMKESDFYPAALKAFTWRSPSGKETLGALPRDISNLVIFYNKDLFAEAHVPEPEPGWTWNTFREKALALTLDRNNDGDPDVFGISFYSKPPLFWLPFVWSAGGSLFDADLKHVTIDSPQAVAGLQWLADLRNKWHVAPKKVESGGATMSQLFLQQKLAMMVSGRWSVPVLREQARFNWDVAPLPIGPSGQSRVGIDASGYAISAKTPHPQESLALVQFLLSKASIEKVAESGLIVPARPDVAETELFLTPRQDPAHGRAFLEVIADSVPTHTPPRWNELSEELQLALEPVWDGQQPAEEAMKAVKPRLDRLLEVGP